MNVLEAAKRGQEARECPKFPPDYLGRLRWIVTHPAYLKPLEVAAPNEVSALIAAANEWDTQWTLWRFYGKAQVHRIK